MTGQRSGVLGVVVTLTDSSAVVVSTTRTNENGDYLFPGLAAGTYTVTAHAVTVPNGPAAHHEIEPGGLCELTGTVRLAAPMLAAPAAEAVAATLPAGPDVVPDPAPAQLAEEADRGSDRREDAGPQPRGRRAGRRIGLVILVVAAVVAASGGLAYSQGWADNLLGTEQSSDAAAATGPVATAVVERGTISATESWDGTLDRGQPFTVAAQGRQEVGRPEERGPEEPGGDVAGTGTITRLVDQGATVKRGTTLYRIDEQPVALLYGKIPMYRELAPGDSGVDVKQLEKNLAKLGYDGFTADDDYTGSTAEAVRAWQADIGAAETGTVSRADVVFLPEGGRVDTVHADVGDPASPGSPTLDVTGAEQVVSLEVDVDDRDWFDVGTEVTVDLPGGDEVPGTVSTMAVVEVASDDSGEAGGTTDSEILEVEVTLEEKVSDDLVGAPVDVIVAIDKREDVLLVPVNALLALAGGGYGLEIVEDDGTTSIVAVTTGLFGEGKVEVKGDEIAEGTVVGVAGR